MQSFTDHLRSKQVTKLAETAFVLMAERGVHPIKFVEWFATEGYLLSETAAPTHARQWLRNELILREDNALKSAGAGLGGAAIGGLVGSALGPVGTGVGAAVGGLVGTKLNNDHDKWLSQPAQSPAVTGAQQALDSLSRNLPKNFQEKPNFVQSLHAVIASLKAPVQPQPTPAATPAPAPGTATTAPDGTTPAKSGWRWPWSKKPAATGPTPSTAAAPTAPVVASHYNPQEDFLGKMIFERRVRSACTQLIEHDVDPRHFVNWYINEGRFLTNEEQFQEGLGDFFAQVGSGIGSWAGGQGFQHGYNAEKQRRQTQRERDAIGAATHALQQLKEFIPKVPKDASGSGFGGPDILKHIELMLGELTKSQEEQKKVPPAAEGEADTTAAGGEGGAGDQAEAVKKELQTAGVDVTHLKPEMLSKYAQELGAITDPAQRTAKMEELKKLVPADIAIDAVNRNDVGDMDRADVDAIKGIMASTTDDDNAKRQKVAQHIANKAAAPAPAPTDPSMEPTGEHNDLMRSLSAYNERPKSWFS